LACSGPACGKRLERAMASPAPVSSPLMFRTERITVFANPGNRVAVRLGFGHFNHLFCAGAVRPGRPVSLGLRPIMPAHYCPPLELRLRDPPNGC